MTCRALLIGNSVFEHLDRLSSCAYDLANMEDALQSGSISYAKVEVKENQTAAGIASRVNDVWQWGADDDDVPCSTTPATARATASRAWTTTTAAMCNTFSLLQSTLGNVNGTVIVLLDSCESGGLVGKTRLVPEALRTTPSPPSNRPPPASPPSRSTAVPSST